ncbi:progesterone-induced-blocking factor 1 [Clonorchis sinensis]|uniref:Progesterone-induced-blocking factor 1 n=1 Tax=Clonorchis sinensis TaxID=79923 RepID=G7YV48_CLOSI|nr:progesterone-induced-blocking factor 1 [Clonorchis sinensis]
MDDDHAFNQCSSRAVLEQPFEDTDILPIKNNTCSYEDSSSESVSSGKLKHEIRILRSQLVSKITLLEGDKILSQTREADLKDQIQVLSRRLALSTARCEAALQIAAQSSEVQVELQRAAEGQKRLASENASLSQQLNVIKDLLDSLPTDRLVYMTKSCEGTFEIDVEAYSHLKGMEAEKLISADPEKLSLPVYAKWQLHRLVGLFAQFAAQVFVVPGSEILKRASFFRTMNDQCFVLFMKRSKKQDAFDGPSNKIIDMKVTRQKFTSPSSFHLLPLSYIKSMRSSTVLNWFKRILKFQTVAASIYLESSEILSLRRQITAAAETILFEGTTPQRHLTSVNERPGENVQIQPAVSLGPNKFAQHRMMRLTGNSDVGQSSKAVQEYSSSYHNSNPYGDKTDFRNNSRLVTDDVPAADQDFELELAGRRIHFLQADKTHLMNQITSLTEQLTKAEQRLAESKTNDLAERKTEMESARNRTWNAQFLEEQLMEQAKMLKDMSTRECKMLSEVHTKELQLLREQRDAALAELDKVRMALREAERETAQYKQQVDLLNARIAKMLPTLEQPREPMDSTRTLGTRMTCALMELETIKLARQDALLQAEKLSAQLDASKKAYYELEAKTTQERLTQHGNLLAVEEKLRLYETLETKLDEAVELCTMDRENSVRSSHAGHQTLLTHIEQYCLLAKTTAQTSNSNADIFILPTMACRRLEHSLRLAKKITELQLQCQRLSEENKAKINELELTRKEADRLGNMITLVEQPADCLASVLAEREQELTAIRSQLVEERKRVRLKTEECELLNQERNAMAIDLERLLTRRQSLAQLRKQMIQLSQSIREQRGSSTCRPHSSPCHPETINFKRIVSHRTAPRLDDHIQPSCIKPPYTIDRS